MAKKTSNYRLKGLTQWCHEKKIILRQKKYTQQQRIESLEKAVTTLYAMIQAVIDKLPNEKKWTDYTLRVFLYQE